MNDKGKGKKIAIKFTENIVGDVTGNESAFTVTGQEYLYTQGLDYNGPLIDCEYEVDTVEMHPTEEKTLRLTMKGHNEFNSVVGKLTVAYDALIGTLAGKGGAVESFEKEFAPAELVATPNPGVTEFVSVAPVVITAELIPVEYLDAFDKGGDNIITVAPVSVTATLIPIEETNP